MNKKGPSQHIPILPKL